MFAASRVAADALGAVCNALIWVFTRIFDLSTVTVEAPTHIGFFVLLAMSALSVGFGQQLYDSRKSNGK